jgi:hypothetical protein
LNYNSDFKYDLELGQLGEQKLSEILHHKRIEVKTDLLTPKTGNVFIEYSSRNKPSGIATTQAEYYAIVVNETIILKTTTELKSIARKYLNTKRDVLGGDNNTSKGVLVPIVDLVRDCGVEGLSL